MRTETASNGFLSGAEQLDDEQIEALGALGWCLPTGSPEASTPETQPDGSPNFYRDFAQPVRHEAIADLAVRTLTEVLRIPHPGFLEYEAFGDDGPIEFSMLGLKARRAVKPVDDCATIRDKLLSAIRAATGVEALAYDGDGDIAVRLGTALSFTRVIENPPLIRIYSPLVSAIESDPALLIRLNEINASSHGARFVHRDGVLFAVVDLMAQPFVAEHVSRAFLDFMMMANGFDELIKTEFGGRTAFDDEFRSRLRH
jgi:hypothetical protein